MIRGRGEESRDRKCPQSNIDQMNDSTRRNFLRQSSLVVFGAAAATGVFATGETRAEAALRGLDADLAKVLRSYGRARVMTETGTKKVVVGSRRRRLPAVRLGVDIPDLNSYQQSLDAVSRLGELVVANGNTLTFVRDGRYFVIENRLAA